jgi:hypothetical protein
MVIPRRIYKRTSKKGTVRYIVYVYFNKHTLYVGTFRNLDLAIAAQDLKYEVLTSVAKKWRNSKAYRIWKITVIRRDKRCVICNSLKDRQAHHLDDATNHPDKIFDLDNGICVCKQCHSQFHNNFKGNYRMSCTKYDFENFKQLSEYLMNLKWVEVREKDESL